MDPRTFILTQSRGSQLGMYAFTKDNELYSPQTCDYRPITAVCAAKQKRSTKWAITSHHTQVTVMNVADDSQPQPRRAPLSDDAHPNLTHTHTRSSEQRSRSRSPPRRSLAKACTSIGSTWAFGQPCLAFVSGRQLLHAMQTRVLQPQAGRASQSARSRCRKNRHGGTEGATYKQVPTPRKPVPAARARLSPAPLTRDLLGRRSARARSFS